MVSRPVSTTLCMNSARMAVSMRGVVSRVSIGCRCASGASLWLEGRTGSREDVSEGSDERLVRRGGPSGGVCALSSWLLANVP